MALESLVGLEWNTERPYIGGSRQSPDFCFLQMKWYLGMQLTRRNNYLGSPETYCQIFLYPRSWPIPSFSLSCECRLKANGKSYYYCANIREGSCCVFSNHMDEKKINPSGKLEEWQVVCTFKAGPSDRLPFSLRVGHKTVNMSMHKDGPLSVDECVQVSEEVPRDLEALSSDISGLLEDGILPDFRLQCRGVTFPVHRSVLAARSEVFRGMFRNRMLESESGSADIEDLEAPVLQSLLKFVYSGKLEDISEDTASELYEAADKYAVPSLSRACSYWLVRHLTVDNSIDCLKTADAHSDPDFKAAATSFILGHTVVFRSTAWSACLEEHPVLASEVLQTYALSSLQ